ncbi:hypothetical protein ACSMX9_07740 [Streptomyces sp. LE64]|uniref:hypothetical protein n=1 Tax=unclassified Streptomyces TaxID=2593676 RepID=UPI00331CD51A
MTGSARLLLDALTPQVEDAGHPPALVAPALPAPAGPPDDRRPVRGGPPSQPTAVPLTSEPPLAATAPLTSESPYTAGLPLTSEPTAPAAGRDPSVA